MTTVSMLFPDILKFFHDNPHNSGFNSGLSNFSFLILAKGMMDVKGQQGEKLSLTIEQVGHQELVEIFSRHFTQ